MGHSTLLGVCCVHDYPPCVTVPPPRNSTHQLSDWASCELYAEREGNNDFIVN
jgi:hypothetical protein